MNYIKRPHYLDFLRRHRDRPIIKVVSGVRRAGKSVLFQLYKEELLATGVDEDQIIFINFEDLSYYDLRHFPKFQVEVSHPKEIHLATCSPSIF
ncbi:ATPase [Streptococcus pneumoniae]|nr:ATPase [Streptococcus pneumoniae]